MITLQANKLDVEAIIKEATAKAEGMRQLANPQVLTEYANAVFTITAKSFIRAMNIQAKANPKKYHHVYEWNQVGINASRLFFLKKTSSQNGKLAIEGKFLNSKTPVPIPAAMQSPGRTGKSVSKKNIFQKKAEIMEMGRPIVYRATKNLPMLDNGTLRFVAAGTVIKNMNPGGKEVKMSFNNFLQLWYNSKANSSINASGILEKMQEETISILSKKSAGANDVKSGITALLKNYSQDKDMI